MVKIVPLWKIRRELDRTYQKLKRPFSRLYDPYFQRLYDRDWQQKIKVQSGDIPVFEKIALVLIFQPTILRRSTLETCAHLVKNGYAPLVISNTPLSDPDLELLKSCCWNIIVRPNIGYDFGGYRDGIRFLKSLGVNPKRLLILNDSIWFPLAENENLIAQMEDEGSNLVGAMVQDGDQTLSDKSSRHHGFIESFFYLLDEACFNNADFETFWKNYRLSNLKYNAVYDGERKFSVTMQKAGLTVSSIVSRSRLLEKLAVQGPNFICTVLKYSAYTNDELSNACQKILKKYDGSLEWKEIAIAHITRVSAKHHFHSSFCVATITLLGASFLKKGSGTVLAKGYGLLHHEMRHKFLRAVDDGVLSSPPQSILAEIRQAQVQLQASIVTRKPA